MDAEGEPLKSPEDLWQMLDEFLAVHLLKDPLRKMALGTGLNTERRLLIKRLLDNAPEAMTQLQSMEYWLELRRVYYKIEEALFVPNEDQLRTFAAKVIFRGEPVTEEAAHANWVEDTG